MIYITGDLHGEESRFDLIEQQASLKAGDTLIVCGDFGFLFCNDSYENAFLDELAAKPYDICFVDGNHENFPAIFSYPQQEWNGGQVHKIRSNVFHLMRGEIFTIETLTFFAFGGACSIDQAWRTPGISWWEEEIPSSDEYHNAESHLNEHHRKADFILTHTLPLELAAMIGKARGKWPDRELMGYFDYVRTSVQYRSWFCGHMHEDRSLPAGVRILYFDVVQINPDHPVPFQSLQQGKDR